MRRHAKASSAGSRASGSGRNDSAGAAAAPGSSSRSEGSGAPSSRRVPLVLVASLILIAGLALGVNVAAAAPSLTVDPSPTAAYTTAQVSGTVDPGAEEIYYYFQYSLDPGTAGWTNGPLAFSRTLGAGSGSSAVSEQLTGLKPATEYQVRLASYSFSGEESASAAPYVSFTTDAVDAPTVALDPVTTFSDSTAHFSGTVAPNPPAGPLTAADEEAYEVKWHFECEPKCPGLLGGSIDADAAEQTVSADAAGLEPNTAYALKLIAKNVGDPVAGSGTFTTSAIPATVENGPGAPDGKGGYVLQGVVNPHNSALSSCAFEFGTTASYGETIPCASNPGAVNRPVEVTARVAAITLGATYHFRITVNTGAGPTSSTDSAFVPTSAPGAAACSNEQLRLENNSLKLRDCRAYEQVSPVDKESVRAFGGGLTSDGGHAIFLSDGAFAGAPRGGANPYLGSRTATGWRTQWLQPALPSFLTSSLLGYSVGLVNADASRMLLQGDALDSTGGGANGNLYLRDAGGHLTRVTLLAPGIPPIPFPAIVEPSANPDLSHVVFADTQVRLHGPAEGLDPNSFGLYEWTDGALRLVNVDSSGALLHPYGATLGSAGNKANAISRDGERIYFSTPNNAFGAPPPYDMKRVYLRQSGQTTTEISATQCTEPSCEGPALNAVYQGAATDGSVAFFTSEAQLTNAATPGGGLYRYDAGSGELTLLTPDTDPGGAGVLSVIGNSDDGSIVYFVATGTLAEGAMAGASNLYVYDANSSSTHFIATFPADGTGRRVGEVTPSGRYLAFQSTGPNASGYDNAGHAEIYRYDEATKAAPSCLTCLPPGEPASGDSFFNAGGTSVSHNITDDGSRVFFQSQVSLVPGDSNGKFDVYQWHDGTLSLISAGTGSSDSWYGSATPSGSDVTFSTYDRLVPGDQDEQMDVYDARMGGGFPAPPAPPANCVGAGCRSALGGVPAAPGVGSTTFSGKGNSARSGKRQRCRKLARTGNKLKQQARRSRQRAGSTGDRQRARQLRRQAKHLESKAARSTKGCTTKSGPRKGHSRTTKHDRRIGR